MALSPSPSRSDTRSVAHPLATGLASVLVAGTFLATLSTRPASILTTAGPGLIATPLQLGLTDLVFNSLIDLLIGFCMFIVEAITNVFLGVVEQFLFFPPPKQVPGLLYLWQQSLVVFLLLLFLGTAGFFLGWQVFPRSDLDGVQYTQRVGAAIIAVIISQDALNQIVIATHSLSRFFYPDTYSLAFAGQGIADTIAGAGLSPIAALGALTILYLVSFGGIVVFILVLTLRALLIYGVYGLFPLLAGLWFLNYGPFQYSHSLAQTAFRTFALLLAFGLIISGFLAAGDAVGGFEDPSEYQSLDAENLIRNTAFNNSSEAGGPGGINNSTGGAPPGGGENGTAGGGGGSGANESAGFGGDESCELTAFDSESCDSLAVSMWRLMAYFGTLLAVIGLSLSSLSVIVNLDGVTGGGGSPGQYSGPTGASGQGGRTTQQVPNTTTEDGITRPTSAEGRNALQRQRHADHLEGVGNLADPGTTISEGRDDGRGPVSGRLHDVSQVDLSDPKETAKSVGKGMYKTGVAADKTAQTVSQEGVAGSLRKAAGKVRDGARAEYDHLAGDDSPSGEEPVKRVSDQDPPQPEQTTDTVETTPDASGPTVRSSSGPGLQEAADNVETQPDVDHYVVGQVSTTMETDSITEVGELGEGAGRHAQQGNMYVAKREGTTDLYLKQSDGDDRDFAVNAVLHEAATATADGNTCNVDYDMDTNTLLQEEVEGQQLDAFTTEEADPGHVDVDATTDEIAEMLLVGNWDYKSDNLIVDDDGDAHIIDMDDVAYSIEDGSKRTDFMKSAALTAANDVQTLREANDMEPEEAFVAGAPDDAENPEEWAQMQTAYNDIRHSMRDIAQETDLDALESNMRAAASEQLDLDLSADGELDDPEKQELKETVEYRIEKVRENFEAAANGETLFDGEPVVTGERTDFMTMDELRAQAQADPVEQADDAPTPDMEPPGPPSEPTPTPPHELDDDTPDDGDGDGDGAHDA